MLSVPVGTEGLRAVMDWGMLVYIEGEALRQFRTENRPAPTSKNFLLSSLHS